MQDLCFGILTSVSHALPLIFFGAIQANGTLLLEEQCGCGESFMV